MRRIHRSAFPGAGFLVAYDLYILDRLCMVRFLFLFTACLILMPGFLAAAQEAAPSYPQLADGSVQFAAFPKPTEFYPASGGTVLDTLRSRAEADPFNVVATAIFILAIVHTFAAGFFNKLAHHYHHIHEEALLTRGKKDAAHPDGEPEVSFRATLFHFLGEVEAVFGIWVIALGAAAAYFYSWKDFKLYLSKDRNFTEPLFVIVIMAIAASRPILRFAEKVMSSAAGIGKGSPGAWWLSVLTIAPILGSFITEPAAITSIWHFQG